MLGVKMFVATPKGGIAPEEIPLEPSRLIHVTQFMDYTSEVFLHWELKAVSNTCQKDRSKCVDLFGECPYYALCEEGVEEKKDYFDMLVKAYYEIVDPMEHLMEQKV
jgi:hypothetical protein